MVKDILSSHEERMKKTLEAAKHEFASLRAGRATPSLLDKVLVDYYGAPTPVNQIAKVTVPEPRMIMIQPWEKSILHDIEVAIMKSDLGLNPNSDGTAIRLTIPQLTQERRKELVKAVNKKAEEAKVALRNIRRDGNDAMKKIEKSKEITEDESKRGQESMQTSSSSTRPAKPRRKRFSKSDGCGKEPEAFVCRPSVFRSGSGAQRCWHFLPDGNHTSDA